MVPISGPTERQVHFPSPVSHGLGPFKAQLACKYATKISDLTNVDQCPLFGDELASRVKGITR
jgi:hypothetical protein